MWFLFNVPITFIRLHSLRFFLDIFVVVVGQNPVCFFSMPADNRKSRLIFDEVVVACYACSTCIYNNCSKLFRSPFDSVSLYHVNYY